MALEQMRFMPLKKIVQMLTLAAMTRLKPLNPNLATTDKWIKEQYYNHKAGKRVGIG
jgi:hypothetical protein